MSVEAVAIVGAGARMPGADTVERFWQNLRAGADTISRFGPDELRGAGVAEELIAEPDYVPARGVVEGGELFDWRYFGYSLAEARGIDPQQRLFLEVCLAALNGAAIDPARFPGWIGVFAGCDVITEAAQPLSVAGLVGTEKDFLATRVAYKLGLRGPAITVQTACSTSLVATHQACQSLLNHECDAALAGGVSLWLPQLSGYRYQQDSILSADGYCRTFDAACSGTVSSNGAGVVALRRLSDALSDGDPILAVLRGSAVNNDGGQKMGFTAPSVTGQRDVIRLALAQADVDPADLCHVEAHGTATQLGDPIEVAALTSAFRHSTDRVGYCWLGSVKSNIGHTGAAAGVAGLLKTALMLRHRELVPSLHFDRPNPKLGLESSPFQVITEPRPVPDGVALAGVSSFGIGGTNVHAVLETPPSRSMAGRGPAIFCLSASTPSLLRRAEAELAEHQAANPELDPVAVAWTLATGRPELPYRTSIVPGQPAGIPTAAERPAGSPRIGLLFPGQGALCPGAAQACLEYLPVFREHFEHACRIVRQRWSLDLATLLAPDAPAEPLRASLVQQLGLFAIGYALGQQLLSWDVRPVAMLGHSAGEYAAAAVAGMWGLADGLELIAQRALAMREGPAGGLIAVYAGADQLPADHGLTLATEGPGQLVLAGTAEQVERLRSALAGTDLTATVLDADRPFHTERMRPAVTSLRAALDRLPAAPPALPVISNLTGELATADQLANPDYWAEHLCRPVRLTAGMATLLGEGCDLVIELGPGRTMTGGLRRHPDWTDARTAVPLIGRPTDDRRTALLGALGTMWQLGAPVRWDDLFDQRPARCALPPVPLDSQPCVRDTQPGPSAIAPAPTGTPAVVVVGDQPDRVAELAERLQAAGTRVAGSHVAAALPPPLAGELDWPDEEARLSARPDLVAALREHAAGLVGQLVADQPGVLGADGPLAGYLRSLLAERGWLVAGQPVGDLAGRAAEALAGAGELPELAGVRRLLRHCLQRYPEVLAGRLQPLEVLYPGGSEKFLNGCLGDNRLPVSDAEVCLRAITASVPGWAGDRPGLRVLEVGAGRGGLTWPLLASWPDRAAVSYRVSDISPMLVGELARHASTVGEARVRASVFDLTADPAEQGLVPGSYDLLLGYNAVHLAASIPDALANLRRLLRPNGTLCLIELTRAEPWQHLVWGLAPGWWRAPDALRASGSPELSEGGWISALAEAGFRYRPAGAPAGLDHAVLIATLADAELLTDPAADLSRQWPAGGSAGGNRLTEPASGNRFTEPAGGELAALGAGTARADRRHAEPRDRFTAPADGSTADVLAELWCAALGVPAAGRSDDFFALGGESLGVVHLLAGVRERTGVRLPLAEFLGRPTFGALLDRVAGDAPASQPNLLTLAAGGTGTPLFLAAPGAGSTRCYRHLVPLLGNAEPVYGLDTPGLHDGSRSAGTIEEIAERLLPALRAAQPTGPYRLAGWSVGAMLAHELGRRLLAAGERVDRLLAIDGFVPRSPGPIGLRPRYLALGAWYELQTLLPSGGNLGDALRLAGEDQQAAFQRAYRANVLAMLRYRPRPLDCPVVLLHTGLTPRRERRLRTELAANYPRGVRVLGVPGSHHSVLQPPAVAALARLVRQALDDPDDPQLQGRHSHG